MSTDEHADPKRPRTRGLRCRFYHSSEMRNQNPIVRKGGMAYDIIIPKTGIPQPKSCNSNVFRQRPSDKDNSLLQFPKKHSVPKEAVPTKKHPGLILSVLKKDPDLVLSGLKKHLGYVLPALKKLPGLVCSEEGKCTYPPPLLPPPPPPPSD